MWLCVGVGRGGGHRGGCGGGGGGQEQWGLWVIWTLDPGGTWTLGYRDPGVPGPWGTWTLGGYLDLGLPLARGRLVDGHLDGLLVVGDHDGAQRAVVRVDLLVVDGPEAVEHQTLLVPAEGKKKKTGRGTNKIRRETKRGAIRDKAATSKRVGFFSRSASTRFPFVLGGM